MWHAARDLFAPWYCVLIVPQTTPRQVVGGWPYCVVDGGSWQWVSRHAGDGICAAGCPCLADGIRRGFVHLQDWGCALYSLTALVLVVTVAVVSCVLLDWWLWI